jgi:hypothetical protein
MKPTDDKQCCGTCRRATFELTPTGRIKRRSTSACDWDKSCLDGVVVPYAFDIIIRHARYVQEDDGIYCPYYVPRG